MSIVYFSILSEMVYFFKVDWPLWLYSNLCYNEACYKRNALFVLDAMYIVDN